jgi:glycosyltransferase involved in cell wall biosynthesis
MQPLSVVIITYNEEENIARCLDSVRSLADEVIVVDSYSTDNTVDIARSMGAVVYREKFRGYIGQKNLAMQLASYNYILSLDADEALDSQLAAAIMEEKKTLVHRAYSMNRCTRYCGHFIRHGLWYPDRKIRLFDRRIARWGGLNPHDKIQMDKGYPVHHLPGDILHYSFNTPEDLVWQNNRLSSIAATSLYNIGVRSSWYKLVVRPAWAFVNGYILRGGFLDGADGFTIAVNTSHQVFLKYSKLAKMEKLNRRNRSRVIAQPLVPQGRPVAGKKVL